MRRHILESTHKAHHPSFDMTNGKGMSDDARDTFKIIGLIMLNLSILAAITAWSFIIERNGAATMIESLDEL